MICAVCRETIILANNISMVYVGTMDIWYHEECYRSLTADPFGGLGEQIPLQENDDVYVALFTSNGEGYPK